MGIKVDKFEILSVPNYFIKTKLNELGISNHFVAYYFLTDILDKMINEDVEIRSFSREVYPYLAEKYNVNTFTIERNIRNLISKKWDNDLKNSLSKFWKKDKPPRCCEFVYILKNYLVISII